MSRICDGAARAIESMKSVACRNARGHGAATAKVTAKASRRERLERINHVEMQLAALVGKASKPGADESSNGRHMRAGMMELSVVSKTRAQKL